MVIVMAKRSAGLLMYRHRGGALELFLVHPGGPYFRRKDAGIWSIPKGEYTREEDAFDAARREFHEETGFRADGEFLPLGDIRQRGGKRVTAWAFEGDGDAASIRSNSYQIEWPPRSGRQREFPEVDRAGWFSPEEARRRIIPSQAELIDRLMEQLAAGSGAPATGEEANTPHERRQARVSV